MNDLASYIAVLAQRRRFGMRPGLAMMEALMARLDHPERELAVIHIAGTNGKGSTAAMVAAVLQAAGLRCGRYTSPHLLRFNERIFVDGLPVTDTALTKAFAAVEVAAQAAAAAGEGEATFFESATAAAFVVFREAGIRLVVLETGLGGRLDATNVVTPLVSVITRIGVDHTEWLGDTIAEIAAEKAGIIKAGRMVVCGAMPPEAQAVVWQQAKMLGCRVVEAATAVTLAGVKTEPGRLEATVSTTNRALGKIHLTLGGLYQAENLATAIAALEAVEMTLGVEFPDEAFRSGLATVCWPGRFQLAAKNPSVIVDGAHNPDCATALATALRKGHVKRPLAMVCGFCDDKDAAGVIKILAPLFERAWAVETPSPRSMTAANLHALLQLHGLEAIASETATALEEARNWAKINNGSVVVCGSLFLAGDVLVRLNAYPWPLAEGQFEPSEALRPPHQVPVEPKPS